MDHPEAMNLLSAYHDGELAPDQARALEAHVAGCAGCRAESEAIRRTIDALRGLRREAPADFDGDVRQQIHRRSRGRFFGPPTWASRVPWEAVSLVTLLGILLVYVFLALSQPGGVVEGGR